MTIIHSIEKLRHSKVRVVFDSENNIDILAETVLKYNINNGLSISTSKWTAICKESRNRLAIREALNFLSKKRRTSSELEQWLSKSFSNIEIFHATTRMQELNYLDDESWVIDYLGSHKARGKSKRYLANQFHKKNIPPDIQKRALGIHNDEVEALWIAQKKVRTLNNLPIDKQKTKLYVYLQQRGFNSALVASIATQLISDHQ